MSGGEEARRAEGLISLQLEEYRALRSEITVRIGSRMTLLGFLVASAALLVGKDGKAIWGYILVGGLIAVGGVVWFWSGKGLGKLSKRLATLENELNARAGDAYGGSQTPLLRWENDMRAERHPVLNDVMS